MKKILFLDVDNTICNSTKRFVEIYNQEYNQQADWTKCYKWDLSDICPLVKDSGLYFAREDFYNDKLELIDNHVKGIIAILYLQGYDVHFITIGTKNNLKYKEQWLERNFPYITKDKYHLLEKTDMGKSEISMINGILVDDNYINLLTSSADLKICMHKETEWNKDIEKSGFKRLHNSMELYNYLMKLEEAGEIIV